MNKINLSGVDLNLLVIFDALIAEGHVTRAAERIGLTQPAVSHALNRLRGLFNDPLFVRCPRGMSPTPVALEMAASIRSILDQVETVLKRDRAFVPATSTRPFRLGLSDYAACVLLPALSARVEREAPGVSLVVHNTSHGTGLGMLEDDIVELVAGNFPAPPAHMREELLYEEDFVCAGRTGHPALAGGLDLARYLELRHLQVSTKSEPYGYVDAVLKEQGLRRTVSVTTSHFLMAPLLVGTSDLVATEPRRLFTPQAERLMLATPPIAIPPFRVVQAWHARHTTDTGHAWLRGVLGEIGRGV